MNANNNTPLLMDLAAQYLDAKAKEDAAVAERRRISIMIEDAMPGASEGTTSAPLDGVKISVTRKVSRTVDADALSRSWGELSENVQRTFRWSADINTKHFRAMQELGTAELSEVQAFITTKPAATSVKVELV